MTDISKVPLSVREALENRGFSDLQILAMNPQQMFNEYCQWHGLINWGNALWYIVVELRAAESD